MATKPQPPMSLCAELTYRCPLQCPYCSNPLHLERYNNELTTEEWLRVLDEAADIGVIQLHFSGGEPLLRTDLEDMVRRARDRDLYSDLSTSGFTATKERLASLKDAGLDAIQVSLLDSEKEGNDRMANVESFDKKCEAVQNAKALGFPVSLNVVLHRHNLDHIEDILELVEQWEVERVELAHVQYVGWAFENRHALLPSRAQLEHARDVANAYAERLRGKTFILHVLPDFYQEVPKACLAGWGSQFMTIAPDGAVLPCHSAREIPGLVFDNVRDASLESIWYQSEAFEKFRGTDWLPEPCQSCERRDVDFGGCRCQAFLFTGDAGRTDPVCYKSPDHERVDAVIREANADRDALRFRRFHNAPAR